MYLQYAECLCFEQQLYSAFMLLSKAFKSSLLSGGNLDLSDQCNQCSFVESVNVIRGITPSLNLH